MFSKLFEDLRFVVGSFFLIIACVLLYLGTTEPASADPQRLNLYAGCGIAVFAVFMLASAIVFRMKE